MRPNQNRKFRIEGLIPDIETVIISVLVICLAVYGRYHPNSKIGSWFALLVMGFALFLMPKITLLIEKGSKGRGLQDANAGFVVLYKVGYILMGLGAMGIILSLLT